METRKALSKYELKQILYSRLDEMLNCHPDLKKANDNATKWCEDRNIMFRPCLLLEIFTRCVIVISEGKQIEDALDSVFTVERLLNLLSSALKEIIIPLTEVEDVLFLDEKVDKIMNGQF